MTAARRWAHEDAEAFLTEAKQTFSGSRELPPQPPAPCDCTSPIVIDDEYGDPFCMKCGRGPRRAA
jgi:hypothetical protein